MRNRSFYTLRFIRCFRKSAECKAVAVGLLAYVECAVGLVVEGVEIGVLIVPADCGSDADEERVALRISSQQ